MRGSVSSVVRLVGIRFTLTLAIAVSFYRVQGQEAPHRFHQTHRAMGTEFAIDLYAADARSATEISNAAFEEIDRLDALLSNYKSASEISRIDREAGAGPVTTDPETFEFLERSNFWSAASDGAFDITVGPLLRAWGFFFHGGRIPSDAELIALRKDIGWEKVLLDAQTRTVKFSIGRSMDLDPGSIGKGFAVDRVVAILRSEGVASAFISAGGSTLYGIGSPPGEEGWPVSVPNPSHPGAIAARVLLKDESLSTGACTEKFFIKDGHRYCHIFDPHTMRPVEGMLQTTVIDPSATDSDALSTVAFVLAPEASARFFTSLVKKGSRTRVLIFPTGSCVAVGWGDSPCGPLAKRNYKETNHD